jgi:hypothetical protein
LSYFFGEVRFISASVTTASITIKNDFRDGTYDAPVVKVTITDVTDAANPKVAKTDTSSLNHGSSRTYTLPGEKFYRLEIICKNPLLQTGSTYTEIIHGGGGSPYERFYLPAGTTANVHRSVYSSANHLMNVVVE